MKNVILVRHAKADKTMHTIRDIDRPLIERGITDAELVSTMLLKEKLEAGKIISSPAIRAYATALIFARNLQIGAAAIQLEPGLYEAEPKFYLEFIKDLDIEDDTVTLFAHNPGISAACSLLTGNAYEDLPTCAVCMLTSNANSWSEILPGEMKLDKIIVPKQLKGTSNNLI